MIFSCCSYVFPQWAQNPFAVTDGSGKLYSPPVGENLTKVR